MNAMNDHAVCALPDATVASNATAKMSFSKIGNNYETFDHANILIHTGTSATTSATFTTMKLSESDSVTSASSMTDIVALTGGTVTSASVGFVLPGESTSSAISGGGNVVEFQLDLRKRKKYVGLSITPGQSLVCGATALLSKASESQDTTTDMTITNNSATNAVGAETLVRL